ncbi:MAG: lycopene cyclase domain-containing protein [Candidatus Diapherotrites archaeon]|uniref:Lycopene cyclase domain-containing protein n=1 Tax=Candidatus Iainarchaeum sp. TaxID=3101447 RepID=A0A8T4C5Z3_9ARCH|nr:lycopene cyclase domain-containing protein [Candidatus Diapherotrites archaeon]
MNFMYAGYLLVALLGTLAFMRVFHISFSPREKRAVIFSLAATVIVFVSWDSWAVSRNHWWFGLENMLGIMLGNQPLEEIVFFAVIPFFGIVLWKISNKMHSLRVKIK